MHEQNHYDRMIDRYVRFKRLFRLAIQDAQSGRGKTNLERLLVAADNRARRRLLFLQKLPIRILFAIPLAVLFMTRSKITIALLLYVFPILVPVAAILAARFSELIGPYDLVLRKQYERLRPDKRAD